MIRRKQWIENISKKIAVNTRKQLLEEKLIQPIQKGFANEELENIVHFFGGKLIFDDEIERAVLESISTTEFLILSRLKRVRFYRYCHPHLSVIGMGSL